MSVEYALHEVRCCAAATAVDVAPAAAAAAAAVSLPPSPVRRGKGSGRMSRTTVGLFVLAESGGLRGPALGLRKQRFSHLVGLNLNKEKKVDHLRIRFGRSISAKMIGSVSVGP